jgi:hypothetical protein
MTIQVMPEGVKQYFFADIVNQLIDISIDKFYSLEEGYGMVQGFPTEYVCPHCKRSKTFAETDAAGRVSCQCANCKQFYIADLSAKRTEKAKARASPNSPRKPTHMFTHK